MNKALPNILILVILGLFINCGGSGSAPRTSTGGQLPFPVILTSVPAEHAKIGQSWVYTFRIDTEPPGGYVEKRFDPSPSTQGVSADLANNKITFTPVAGVATGTPVRVGWLFAANPSATLTQDILVIVDP